MKRNREREREQESGREKEKEREREKEEGKKGGETDWRVGSPYVIHYREVT